MPRDVTAAKVRIGRWLPILLTLLSFTLGSALVDLAVPVETRGNIGMAHKLFEAQADEVDIVFIGSSRIQDGFDAEALEDELCESGEELQAFNYGVPGMHTLEQGHILRQVLARSPARLRWVVLEAGPIGITIRRNTDYSRGANAINARSISWHTTQVTRRALAAIWRLPLPWGERLELASHHVGLWARYLSNLGLLSERLLESTSAQEQRAWQAAGGTPPEEPAANAEEDPGFSSVLGVARRERRAKAFRRRAEQTPEQYEKLAARIRVQNQRPVDLAELDVALIAERVREAREAGVELVFVTMPCEVGCPEILRLHEAGLLGPLLHFNDPERYPELFTVELRKSLGHLNPSGADVFSRLLARELLELRRANE